MVDETQAGSVRNAQWQRDSELLWKLYESFVAEEHYFLAEHQKRIAFFSSLISAIFAATIAGIIRSENSTHLGFLALGPVLTIALCFLAKEGTFRLYQRFLEAIASRAKLEQQMHLTEPLPSTSELGYWNTEALISARHREARGSYGSSAEFIASRSRSGYEGVARRVFLVFQICSVGILVILAALLIGS